MSYLLTLRPCALACFLFYFREALSLGRCGCIVAISTQIEQRQEIGSPGIANAIASKLSRWPNSTDPHPTWRTFQEGGQKHLRTLADNNHISAMLNNPIPLSLARQGHNRSPLTLARTSITQGSRLADLRLQMVEYLRNTHLQVVALLCHPMMGRTHLLRHNVRKR